MVEYAGLSTLYDGVMEEAPYRPWMQYLTEKFTNIQSLHIADVGCGTGVLTAMLAEQAKSVTGVDLSPDMLAVANERIRQLDLKNTQLICQDVRNLELPASVDLVVSTCDTLNYILNPDDLKNALQKIWRVLKPGGTFAFDLLGNGRRQALKQGVWYDMDDEHVVFYETDVSEAGRIDYDVVFFKEEENGLYRRFEEHHIQQLYDDDLVRQLLSQCGFQSILCTGDFGQNPIENADRLVFLCNRE